MKVVKSESGMILATVLMLIVIFSVIGITIINFTVTNAKQTSKIEKDMQSVDIAEMGIIRYRGELVPKLNTELKRGIEQAIASLDQKNEIIAKENAKKTQNLTPYIEINATTVIEEMKRVGFFNNVNRFKLGYSPNNSNSVYPGSTDFYSLDEIPLNPTAPTYPTTIEINVKSTGTTDKSSNEIEAIFKIDLAYIINEYLSPGEIKTADEYNLSLPYLWTNNAMEKPIGMKKCTFDNKKIEDGCFYESNIIELYSGVNPISNINSLLKGNVSVKVGELNIFNSNLYFEGNMSTGTISEFTDSNVQVEGNIKLDNMNGSAKIDNVMIKASGVITTGTIGGSGIINSKIHAGGQLNINEVNNGGIIGSEISAIMQINFKNLNKVIRDSYIYTKENLNFGGFNGQANIVNSIIRTDEILNFHSIDSKIQNGTVIYSGQQINLGYSLNGNMNGTIDSSSYICSKGQIANGIKQKATNNNVIEYVESFEKCLELAGKKSSTTKITKSELKDFSEVIETSVNEAEYIYK